MNSASRPRCSSACSAFLWALRNGQLDDPDGAAERIRFDDDEA